MVCLYMVGQLDIWISVWFDTLISGWLAGYLDIGIYVWINTLISGLLDIWL